MDLDGLSGLHENSVLIFGARDILGKHRPPPKQLGQRIFAIFPILDILDILDKRRPRPSASHHLSNLCTSARK